MNINEHPLYKAIYDLCLEIEKLPASEQQTKVVVMAGELEKPVTKLLIELREAERKLEYTLVCGPNQNTTIQKMKL